MCVCVCVCVKSKAMLILNNKKRKPSYFLYYLIIEYWRIFWGKIIEKINLRQLGDVLTYPVCLFVGNKNSHEFFRSGKEWLPATCGRGVSSELIFGMIETCLLAPHLCFRTAKLSRTELFLGCSRNPVWRQPKFIHT
jgi:hypothetical protein